MELRKERFNLIVLVKLDLLKIFKVIVLPDIWNEDKKGKEMKL